MVMNPTTTTLVPTSDPESLSPHDRLRQLCHELQAAGIWLYLHEAGTLIAGPPELVHRSPALLQRLREHKPALLRLLEDCLAVEIFGAEATDPRFARETCPDCQRLCYVIHPPRRLEAHRLPDGQTRCPGSERAQQACAQTIMQAFVLDCCVQRPTSSLTWYGVRGALTAWCHRRGWLLPPRPYLLAWLDQHYQRLGQPEEEPPRWAGFTLTVQEWFGEDELPSAVAPGAPAQQRKPVLRA